LTVIINIRALFLSSDIGFLKGNKIIMIKKVFYFLFLLFILWGFLSLIIDFSGLNEFLVYGLGLPAGGIFFFANKNRILSDLNTDLSSKKNGLDTEYYFSFNPFSPSPKKMEISYKDGKIDGRRTQWYKNGQKHQEGNFKEGKEDGIRAQWHKNGQKEREVNYVNSKQEGLETSWHENGQKESEVNYKDGKREGKTTLWHENGQKEQEGNFNDDKQDGKMTWWHEDGWKQQECNFKDDKEDGMLTMWNKNGQKEQEGNYKDGECISGDC